MPVLDIGSRPTQLDARGDRPTEPELGGKLKRVTLVRATDAPETTSETAAAANAYVGFVVDGRYRLESVIGRGGMGVVYQARHQVIDKLFAVKILLPTEDADVVARFMNEARAATAIGNAHITDTVDFGELPDGSTYFAMEYLDGETLSRRIKRDGFLALDQALQIGRQIAEAMHAAHDAEIVHRDLKPDNIYLIERDKEPTFVKLLDFGIAKVANAQNKLTRAGTIFGTPHYMSPEQAAGAEVDHRTDIYALGVMIYEMVAGRLPFDAENPMGLLTQHMYTPPPPLTKLESPPQSIPVALDAVVLQCLAKKAEERYATMADLGEDLDRVARGETPRAIAYLVATATDPALAAAARAASRTGGKSGFVWLGLLSAAIAGGAYFALGSPPSQTPLPEPAASDPNEGAGRAEGVPLPSQRGPQTQPVALVLSPIDAEVFLDDRNLGTMPVSVPVPVDGSVEVEVRRDGFYAERVRLDGSQRRIIVQLSAIPGAKPAVPVPDEDPIERWKRSFQTAGRVDGGPRPKRTSGDAGAPPKAAVAPPARPPVKRDGGAAKEPAGPREKPAAETPSAPHDEPPTRPR
jgi:serine/threonine-protein kinase